MFYTKNLKFMRLTKSDGAEIWIGSHKIESIAKGKECTIVSTNNGTYFVQESIEEVFNILKK